MDYQRNGDILEELKAEHTWEKTSKYKSGLIQHVDRMQRDSPVQNVTPSFNMLCYFNITVPTHYMICQIIKCLLTLQHMLLRGRKHEYFMATYTAFL
jgi:hypothetical protein